MSESELVYISTALAGILALIALLTKGKQGYLYLKPKVQSMFASAKIQENLNSLSEQVAILVSEMRPNCGSTIKDSLDRIENRQLLQEQRHRALLTELDSGFFEADRQGSVVWVNRAYAYMVRKTPMELIGAGWINAVHGSDRSRVLHEWDTAIEADRESEIIFQLNSEVGLNVQMRTIKMTDNDGTTLGFIGTLRQVKED